MDDPFASLPLSSDRIEALRGFVRQLRSIFQDRLVSVALCGSLGAGELSLAVITDQLALRDLRLVVDSAREARQSARIAPAFFTRNDLERSTDVFPLRFLEMRRTHRTLHGEEVLGALEITPEHMRLACEHTAKSMLVQQRELYLANAHLRPALAAILADQAATLLSLMRTILELSGETAPDDVDALLAEAATRLGWPTDAFQDILALPTLPEPPGRQDLERLYGALMAATDALATYVDRL